MLEFYCNKRFDISFSDFHKLLKVILPTNYKSYETRGTYKIDYMPCNIIEIYEETENSKDFIGNIYCWLGQKGLTILSDNPKTVSLCIEVTKELKQNPDDYKILTYPLVDEFKLIDDLSKNQSLLVYKQINNSINTSKYIIREFNNDEVLLDFYISPDSIRLSGSVTSLFTLVKLSIEQMLK